MFLNRCDEKIQTIEKNSVQEDRTLGSQGKGAGEEESQGRT